jgi:hypothetical protein
MSGVNRPHVDELARVADEWRPDLKRLEQLQSTSQMSQREYAESWAFVHYLLESSPENRTLLRDHLQALVRSTPHPPLSDELARLDPRYAEHVVEHLAVVRQSLR